ncbi:hypothetical protein LTR85_005651 [Meristemomyces frigidus]|nr:hypothetical protein LTR85_005651 [Meristemomyces frigidus]
MVDWTGNNLMIVQFFLTRADDFSTLAYITIHMEMPPTATAASAYQPRAYTGAPVSLDLAKGWLETCRTSHVLCQAERTPGWRPSRLLRLPVNGVQTTYLMLREASREEYGLGVEYMTLSHRWAPGQQLQLLTRNHHRLRNEIPIEELKVSIQHAVTAAQHLAIDYLWVDTLCIIQDDEEDRDREIQQMDRVYGNSACNVSASEADCNDEGCFYNRDETLVKAFKVRLDADCSDQARHVIHREWQHSRYILDTCVLSRRAWVFQERVLSPRVLSCCKQELQWECRELEASETYPVSKPEYATWGLFQEPSLKTVILRKTNSTSPWDDVARAREVWRRIVRTYARCALTYPEDKLRALAGITHVWQRLHDDEYIAGFWRKSLLRDLLWVRDLYEHPSPPRDDAVTTRAPAPSWSWASICGPVYFLNDWHTAGVIELMVTLKDVSWQPPVLPPVQQNSQRGSAHPVQDLIPALQLCGRPVPARWAEHPQGSVRKNGYARLMLSTGVKDADSGKPQSGEDGFLMFDHPSALLPEDIICLPIILNKPSPISKAVSGLVLTVSIGASNDSWRLGTFGSDQIAAFDVAEIDLTL